MAGFWESLWKRGRGDKKPLKTNELPRKTELAPPPGLEKETDPEITRLRKIVFWSFFASQGQPKLQQTILSNALRLYPELLPATRRWADTLDLRVRNFTRGEAGELIEVEEGGDPTWSVDEERLLKDPSGAHLLSDIRRFLRGFVHPAGSVPSEKEPDRFEAEVRKETNRRVSDLLHVTVPPLREGSEPDYATIQECAEELIQRDVELMNTYTVWEEEIRGRVWPPDQHARLEDRLRARRDVIGVSLLCKYGLSEKRLSFTPRLAPEIQKVFEEIGSYLRENKAKYMQGRGDAPSDLAKLLLYWEEETGEKIEF